MQVGRNVVHGSDSTENGERETGARGRGGERECHCTARRWQATAAARVPGLTPPPPPHTHTHTHPALWFGKDDLVAWESTITPWLVE